MSNRFSDAIAIQSACNPSGIASALMRAQRVIYDEGKGTDAVRADPAVRLMVHQLAYLCDVGPGLSGEEWRLCHQECLNKSEE
jgi:aromatic ring hydroxylase